MFRAVIIDDEQMGINTLKVMLEKHTSNIKLVGTTTEPKRGIEMIEDYHPEIVFLDISMPQMNGFELLKELKFKDFKLVFTTAHESYALKAIKNKPQDFLLKPIDIDELKTCINSIFQGSDKHSAPAATHANHIIKISVKDGILLIKTNDILRLEASGSYTIFHLANGTQHIASKTLKEYEAMLEPSIFYRCHLSHIINLHKAVKLVNTNGLFVQMADGSLPEIARKNRETFLEKLSLL